jgi:hypothetical protein
MVLATERLWMFGLRKWRITCMPPRLDDIRPWNSPNLIWKAMPPLGGGQWDKRKGRAMATLGSSSRTVLRPSFSQGTPTTFRGVNFVTLWMSQMRTWGNMWELIPNSCLRSDTCTSRIVCANLWWDFRLGQSESLRKIDPPHYLKPLQKWKVFRMWGGVKKSGFKKDNKFFHKKPRHEGEWNRGQGSPTKDKPKQFQGSGFKPKGNFVKKGAPFKGSQPKGDFWGETQRNMFQLQRSGALFQGLPQVQIREWGL